MKVAAMLAAKGREVATISQSQSFADAVHMLRERRIGALVVTGGFPPLVGIFSERDVVRAIAEHGAAALTMPVSAFMSPQVTTCTESASADGLMALMTDQRIRHVPVIDNNVLVGMISIGDVVKSRLAELEHEKRDLLDYVSAR
jgi:CBS domain-containing protein